MLHRIPEICELVGKSRSEIYAMLNNGDMSYVIGQDGKRKIDTSEIQRVFPDLVIDTLLGEAPNVSPERKSITLSAEKEADTATQQNQTRELYELRGMITDLRSEIDNVLDDNRRLLRLLEYQTMGAAPAEPEARPDSRDMASQGWKQYQKMRAEDEKDGESNPEKAPKEIHWLEAVKRFFLKY